MKVGLREHTFIEGRRHASPPTDLHRAEGGVIKARPLGPELASLFFVVPAQNLVHVHVAIAVVVLADRHSLGHQRMQAAADVGPVDLATMLDEGVGPGRDFLAVVVVLDDVAAAQSRPDRTDASVELVVFRRHPVVRMM